MAKQGLLPLVTEETKELIEQSFENDSYLFDALTDIKEKNPYINEIIQFFSGDCVEAKKCGVYIYKLLEKESMLPRVTKESYLRFREEAGLTCLVDYIGHLTKMENIEKNPLIFGVITTFSKQYQNRDKNIQDFCIYTGLFTYRLLEIEAKSRLEAELNTAVKTENYEEAAKIRDKLNSII